MIAQSWEHILLFLVSQWLILYTSPQMNRVSQQIIVLLLGEESH